MCPFNPARGYWGTWHCHHYSILILCRIKFVVGYVFFFCRRRGDCGLFHIRTCVVLIIVLHGCFYCCHYHSMVVTLRFLRLISPMRMFLFHFSITTVILSGYPFCYDSYIVVDVMFNCPDSREGYLHICIHISYICMYTCAHTNMCI